MNNREIKPQIQEAEEAIRFSLLAAEAIKALGNITMPVGIDEPLVHTDRADVATVFRFFGEVLVAPLERAADVMGRVARDAQ